MTSAKFQLSPDNGGTWLAEDVALAGPAAIALGAGNATVLARLTSLAGVSTVEWTIIASSEGAPPPEIFTYGDRSAMILVPRATGAAYLLRARVNGGVDPRTGRPSRDLVSVLALKVLSTTGAELLAPGETDEGNRTYGWTSAYNALTSLLGGGGGGGGGGSFTGIALTDPVASFATSATFVAYDGIYFTAPGGGEIGWNLNGTLVPPSWTSMVTDGWVLYIAPAAGTGKKIELYAQPSTDGIGGSIGLFSGNGATESGSVSWGRQSTSGDTWVSGRLTTAGIEFCREESPETSSTIGGGAVGDMTFRRLQASVTKGMVFELVSDTPDGDHAFEAFYRFSYGTNSSLRIPLIIGYESVRVSGTITQVQPEAFSPSEMDVTSECAPSVSTSSTTPTLLTSLAVPTNRCVTVTVSCQHDNGTTTGRTVYSAVFRRGAGSASTETAAVDITPSSAMKKSHAVTIALNSNTIEIKVVAASATATKHRAQVAWEVGTIS